MKKVYLNPEMNIYCVGSEMLTDLDIIRGSQEADNLIFNWGGEREI